MNSMENMGRLEDPGAVTRRARRLYFPEAEV